MIKRLSVLVSVYLLLSGCAAPDFEYEHTEYGIVKVSGPIYQKHYKECEDKFYSDGVLINGKQVRSKKELDNIKRNFDRYFGSTVYKKGLSDWQVLAKHEEYKKTWPDYVFEIEARAKEHSRCMWEAGFTPDKRIRPGERNN